ncbi:MAG: PilN domain-containing protein [Sinobacteraceae bacterium]|nr:PilN domain-containing protein [Nevskiaceae bacterium]
MNTKINLLDWRSERRERRRKEFLSMIVTVVVVAVAIAVIVTLFLDSRVGNQQARNRYLKQQIAQTDKQIAQIKDLNKVRDNLLARMHVIESLQQDRSATVHFFDALESTLPDGVYLQLVQEHGGTVTLKGVAQSNGRVSRYMKNLDASDWFDNPRLVVIKTRHNNHQQRSDFTLLVKNSHPEPKAGKGNKK